MIIVWRISSCFSPSLSQDRSSCEKSGLEENIITTIIASKESVSTQCLYILCDAFAIYLVVVWAYWLELTNFMGFTPLQHPQHVMILRFITPSNDKNCLFIWERWCELKSGIFFVWYLWRYDQWSEVETFCEILMESSISLQIWVGVRKNKRQEIDIMYIDHLSSIFPYSQWCISTLWWFSWCPKPLSSDQIRFHHPDLSSDLSKLIDYHWYDNRRILV